MYRRPATAPHTTMPPPTDAPLARLGLLLGWLAAGAGVSAIGHALSGDTAWVLAVPLALVVGWWRVADPTRCTRGPQ